MTELGKPPLSPDQVAERWGCSDNHVRNLFNRGELAGFRLGHRLIRIPVAAVHEYEQRQILPSAPAAPKSFDPDPIVIRHSRERSPRPSAQEMLRTKLKRDKEALAADRRSAREKNRRDR